MPAISMKQIFSDGTEIRKDMFDEKLNGLIKVSNEDFENKIKRESLLKKESDFKEKEKVLIDNQERIELSQELKNLKDESSVTNELANEIGQNVIEETIGQITGVSLSNPLEIVTMGLELFSKMFDDSNVSKEGKTAERIETIDNLLKIKKGKDNDKNLIEKVDMAADVLADMIKIEKMLNIESTIETIIDEISLNVEKGLSIDESKEKSLEKEKIEESIKKPVVVDVTLG